MNLLLINGDQFRHDCLGFLGLRKIYTPHLDRLAKESLVYENAFTPLPVCAPARQALLSGRHPNSFGAQWNYDFSMTPTVQPQWCWPKDLAAAGMQTAYLGRFHVSPEYKPADFGYQKHVSWAGHKAMIREKYGELQYEGGWFGCTNPVALEDSGTHWMADQACKVLEEFSSDGRPWHMWVDYEEPHLPCRPSMPFASMYNPDELEPWSGFEDTFQGKPYCHRQQTWNWNTDSLTWEDFAPMVARYHGLVSQLDDAIGKILKKLEDLGQKDDTIVVFTSDHGDMCGSHHMLDKHYVLYDDIIRVPLLVRIPGKDPGTMRSFVSNCLDIPASIRNWFLLEKEKEHGHPLPEDAFADENGRTRICVASNGQQFGLYSTRTLRESRWKYVWNLTDIDELYDLWEDPGELCNRIGDPNQKERITRMRHQLYELLEAQEDPLIGSEWIYRQLWEERKFLPKEL